MQKGARPEVLFAFRLTGEQEAPSDPPMYIIYNSQERPNGQGVTQTGVANGRKGRERYTG